MVHPGLWCGSGFTKTCLVYQFFFLLPACWLQGTLLRMNISNENEALNDFRAARQRAAIEELLSRLTGRPNTLLSYEEIAQKLHLQARSERGLQLIPLDAIVGSVGRYDDFTRSFLPRNPHDQERWVRVRASLTDPTNPGWPPIEVYKVGEAYFVLDGNHRVSIARQEGWTTIEARVIEVQTLVPLRPDMRPEELIVQAEYVRFLEETSLRDLRPEADLSVTAAGQYDKLREHIQVHRYFMGIDFQRDIDFSEAVAHWYDSVYLTIIQPIREGGLLRWFPGRTETDLYLWVSEYRAMLEKELGWQVRPQAALAALVPQESASSEPGAWRKMRLMDRYTGHLFEEILVPLSGQPESWAALEQAFFVAQRELAHVYGLHLAQSPETVAAVQAEFDRRCEQAGVRGTLAVESGEPARRIVERSRLVDLVVMRVKYPPAAGLAVLTSPLRSLLERLPRPVLALPAEAISPLQHVLLAYDDSPKSREALFLAAYLAERFQTRLTVFTASESAQNVQEHAHSYLELHELRAEFASGPASHASIIAAVQEHACDLALMGSYGASAWSELLSESAVSAMLREAKIPLLICQ